METTSCAATSKGTREWMAAFLILALALPCVAQSSTEERVPRVVLVSIADRRLAVLENGNVLAYFPVAVGAAVSPSPTGEFVIVSRVANPTYYHEGLVMPAGRGNPVGTRWMGLNVKGYGIHGTNAPRSVGHATSHGCIRLRNRDVERLYAMLRVGDIVEIRGGRDEEIASVFGGDGEVARAQVNASNVGQ
ncbi:MAG: L,D-transpeptidase [Candidatus Sulfotelmatobacter sp.]|jgi:L,D-transpeptidase ErfK/SrfK